MCNFIVLEKGEIFNLYYNYCYYDLYNNLNCNYFVLNFR